MKNEAFDVFVIGSGIAGQVVAETCADQGLKVAIADRREYGGTCANRGCDPKKVILGITEIMRSATKLRDKGVVTLPTLSWEDLQRFKCTFTDAVPAATENDLKDKNITLFHQSPKFINETTLSVEGKTVIAQKIVIATGLIPRPLDIEGGDLALLSDDFLNQESLPDSMIFIGAGYIGMEFAHMAARFGVEVTVIDRGARPLSIFDKDMVDYLVKASEEIGIKFIFNANVKSIETLQKNKRVHYTVDGKEASIKAERIFNTTGRIPSISELELEKGDVSYTDNGIEVDAYLQNTGNENVYACGDVSDHAVPLTPFSGNEGDVVAQNILDGNSTKARFPVTPSVAFTLPNIASVGLSEAEARKQYSNVTVLNRTAAKFYNAKRVNEQFYAYKTIVDTDTDKILGAHLLGPEAGEVINLFMMAIHQGTTTTKLKEMIFTYPSWGGDIQYMV